MQSFGFPHSLVVARVSTRVKICKIILEKENRSTSTG